MTLKYNSLDVYFHMTNHYKKLRSVKSVVDTSSPVGYYERQSRPPSRAEHRRETQLNDGQALKIRNDKFKNSLNFSLDKKCKSKLIRSSSVPSRPQTRRRLVDMPTTEVYPQRAKSISGPFVKENSNIPKLRLSRSNRSSRYNSPSNSSTPRSSKQHGSISSRIKTDNRKVVLKGSEPPIPAPRKPKIRRNAFKNWIIEHDYMEFMLRITEDIIQNNLYTGEEILQVLNSHIEANVDRLSVPKMMKQIRILCYELNVPFEKVVIGNANIKTEFMEPLELSQKNLICTCNSLLHNKHNNKHDFGDCECATKRSSPFQCIIHNGKKEIGDLLKINEDFSPAQNIIDTYFFKNADDSTNSKQTTSINNSAMNDQESTSTLLLTPHSLSCVPELSETSESPAVPAIIYGNQPQTSQPSQIYCTSQKTPTKHVHPCNCKKSKQWQLHTHAKFNKSSNGIEDQSQNNKNKIENSVNSLTKQVAENVFHIGCPCSNPTEASPIVTGPLDYVFCCTNIQHVDNKHQFQNEPFVFQNIDKTRTNLNEIDLPSDATFSRLPVTQKPHFYNVKESPDDKDEEFVMSLGTAYIPKSVSQSGNRSLFENVCIIAPDAKEKCKLIVLKNLPKQVVPASSESNVSEEISSYIIEVPQVNNKKILPKNKVAISMKDNENNQSDKCGQLCSTATMTSSKCCSEVVHDKNKKSCYKTSSTTQGATITDKTNKNIFLIVPDDVKHDQIFVVRKSQFEKLDTQSGISHESEFKMLLKNPVDMSPRSSMPSCMEDFKDSASFQSSTCSANHAHKIKKNSNLKNITKAQFSDEASQNMDPSPDKSIEKPTSTFDNKRSLQNYHFSNSFSSGDTYLTSAGCSDTVCNDTVDNCNSKILVKLNDYDLTPQRDSNSTSSSNRRIMFSLDGETLLKNYLSDNDKLLLGNEYEINKSSSSIDYSKGIPDSIKKFYPNTASQTGPSDDLSSINSISRTSMTKSNDLEPKTNSNSSIENQEKVDAKSQSTSSMPFKYQREEEYLTDNVSVLKQVTDLQLDLMLDFELTSEEQSQQKTSASHNHILLDNQSYISSSTSAVFEEPLVSIKSMYRLEDPTATSLASMKIDENSSSDQTNNTQIVNDHDEKININKKSALKSHLPRATNELPEFTNSELSLMFTNNDAANVDSVRRRTNDSVKGSIKGSKFRMELSNLIENSNIGSNIDNPSDVPSKVSNEAIKKNYAPPRSSKEITNFFNENDEESDDDNDDYSQSSQTQNNEKSSFSTSLKSDANVVKNEQQPTYEFEKPSFKKVDSKPSTQSSQRRVLIKEQSVDDVKESLPFATSRHDSVPMQLPYIEIEPSDTAINTSRKRNSSNDSTQTSCCGLKSSKAKIRRDVIEVDKNLQTTPNISTIPDDQLFEVEMRRPTNAGYGADRKSLRFEYSMMSELIDEKVMDVNLPTNSDTVHVEGSKSSKTEQTKPENKNTLDSSLIIDIFKPGQQDSNDSFMIDNLSLKEKNNENVNINDF